MLRSDMPVTQLVARGRCAGGGGGWLEPRIHQPRAHSRWQPPASWIWAPGLRTRAHGSDDVPWPCGKRAGAPASLSSPKNCKVQAAARSGQPALRIFLARRGRRGTTRASASGGGGRRGNTKRTASTPQRSSFLLRDSCDVHGKRYADVVNSHRARPPFKSKLFLSAERRTIYKKSTAPSSSTGTAPPRANT